MFFLLSSHPNSLLILNIFQIFVCRREFASEFRVLLIWSQVKALTKVINLYFEFLSGIPVLCNSHTSSKVSSALACTDLVPYQQHP